MFDRRTKRTTVSGANPFWLVLRLILHFPFGYSRRGTLFQNLNLSLERGHIYGLLGKNGAGKTTLLKNIVGLAFPWADTCLIDEQPAAARQPRLLEDSFFLSQLTL